nr:MAG TPA: hypothetical protein [Caudoviricetes sp.]
MLIFFSEKIKHHLQYDLSIHALDCNLLTPSSYPITQTFRWTSSFLRI